MTEQRGKRKDDEAYMGLCACCDACGDSARFGAGTDEHIGQLRAGEELTYLAYYCYNGGKEYAYVQGELDGRPVCGFIPFDAIAW